MNLTEMSFEGMDCIYLALAQWLL